MAKIVDDINKGDALAKEEERISKQVTPAVEKTKVSERDADREVVKEGDVIK